MRFYNKLKSAMLVAASLFCFNAAFADTALIAWGNCSTSSIEGTTIVNQLVGNEGDTAEGFVLSLTGNTAKTYDNANKLTVPLPDGTSGERTTIKLSNGAENTLTLPEGAIATKITFYSYVNYNLADKDNKWGRTSYWKSVAGKDYTAETADTLKNWLKTKTTYTADGPDVRSFDLDNVTGEIKFTNTGEQACVIIAVEYTKPSSETEETPTYEWQTVYSWASTGTVVQSGGAATYVNGSTTTSRANYQHEGHYTLCLNGKSDNINDATASDKAGHIDITFDEALQAGDSIYITAYRWKNANGKEASIYFRYENGTVVRDSAVYANICNDGGVDYDNDGNEPTTHAYAVPDKAAGSKVLSLTRNATGTNLFITSFIVKRKTKVETAVVTPWIRTLASDYVVGEGTKDDVWTIKAYVTLPKGQTAWLDGSITGYQVASVEDNGNGGYVVETLSPMLNLEEGEDGNRMQIDSTGTYTLTINVPKYYNLDGTALLPRLESLLRYSFALYEDEDCTKRLTLNISGRAQLENADVTCEFNTETVHVGLTDSISLQPKYAPADMFANWKQAACLVYGNGPDIFCDSRSIRVDENTLSVKGVALDTASFTVTFIGAATDGSQDTTFAFTVIVDKPTFSVDTTTITIAEGDSAQIPVNYTPKSLTWQQAALLAFDSPAEEVVPELSGTGIRINEETLLVYGFYPGTYTVEIPIIGEAMDGSQDTTFTVHVIVTEKVEVPEEVEEPARYQVVQTYDFVALAADNTLSRGTVVAGKVYNNANSKNNDVYYVTTPGLETLVVQDTLSGSKGWSLVKDKGLVMGTGAGRCAALTELAAGQVVDIYWTVSSGLELYVADRGNTALSGTFKESDRTALLSAPKDTLLWDATNGHAQFLMKEDGAFGFEFNKKANAITKITVSLPAKYVTTSSWDFKALAGDEIAITYLTADKTYQVVGQSGWTDASVTTTNFGDGLAFTRLANISKMFGFWLRNENGGAKRGLLSRSQSHTMTVYGLSAGTMVTLSTATAPAEGDITAYNSSESVKWSENAVNDTCIQYTMETDGDLNLQFSTSLYITALSISELKAYESVGSYDYVALASKAEGASYLTSDTDYGNVGQSGWTYSSYTAKETGEGVAYARLASSDMAGKGFFLNNSEGNVGLTSGTGDYAITLSNLSKDSYITIEANSATALTGTFTGAKGGTSDDLTTAGSSTFKYRMTSDGDFNVIMAKGAYVKSIDVTAPVPDVALPTITTAGNSYDSVKVTLAIATEGAEIHYTIGSGEEQTYSEPFTLTESATVTAWGVADGKAGKTTSLDVVAGYIVTPAATITKVSGTSRDVTLATETPGAKITYFLGESTEGVAYSAPFTVAEETALKAIATLGEFTSDTLNTTIAAGTEVQLATAKISVIAVDSANFINDVVLSSDQSDVLCTPTAQVQYTFYPLDETTNRIDSTKAETQVVNDGDTISLGIGLLSAVAVNDDYLTSEPATSWLRKPADYVEAWSLNFDTIAVQAGATTSDDVTATVGDVIFSGYYVNSGKKTKADFQVALANSVVMNENFGLFSASNGWLLRAGKNGFWGLHNGENGSRGFGICNLKAGQRVYLLCQNASQILTEVYGQGVKNEALSSGNELYYDITEDGQITITMNKGYTIHKIAVLESSDKVYPVTYKLEYAKTNHRYLSLASDTKGADIYYAIGKQKIDTLEEVITNGDLNYSVTTIDTTVAWGDYQLYDPQYNVDITPDAPYLHAYATSQGISSDVVEYLIEFGTIDLVEPVITFVENTDAGKRFVITAATSDEFNGQPINYTLPGGTSTMYTDTLLVANNVYGWMSAVCELDGQEPSTTTYRYLDARASYNEPYVAIVAESDTLPAVVADLEFANVAELSVTQKSAVTPTGNIYFHKQVHANYNSLVLPFNLTTANLESGAVKVTDASGKSLVRGTDYELARIQKSTDYTNIAADLAAGKLTHTANIVNSHTYLLKVADNLVGQDLIFVSAAGTTISVSKPSFSAYAADGSWNVVNNSTFAPIVTEVPVYYVNDAGDALVRQDAGFVIAPFTSAVIADEATTAATAFIPLISGATAIESIGADLEQQGVVFDMMGRRVQDMKAGHIYIIGGKKVMR